MPNSKLPSSSTTCEVSDPEFCSASWVHRPQECTCESAAHSGSVKSSLSHQESASRNLPALCRSCRRLRSLYLFLNNFYFSSSLIACLTKCQQVRSNVIQLFQPVLWRSQLPDTRVLLQLPSFANCWQISANNWHWTGGARCSNVVLLASVARAFLGKRKMRWLRDPLRLLTLPCIFFPWCTICF